MKILQLISLGMWAHEPHLLLQKLLVVWPIKETKAVLKRIKSKVNARMKHLEALLLVSSDPS